MESPQDNEAMPLQDGFNFTPIYQGQRVRMRAKGLDHNGQLIVSGSRQVQHADFRGVIEDTDTHIPWIVRAIPCSISECFCDAEIERQCF